ncbi:MAG: glycerate kinase [SAR202 cluster bacterium]|nr:glycerate kinase [SAR202 cluster bacterium]
MKIVIAPDSYKGSIYAPQAARAMRVGVLRVLPDAEVVLVPVADGGDGTLEALVATSSGESKTAEVTGPMGEQVRASWGALGDNRTAVIEMARTSGLALVPTDKRDPLVATTFGLGEMIEQALESGYRSFILGIGGSATNDAGSGMAQALGIRLLDRNGADLPFGGGALSELSRIDMKGIDPRVSESEFSVACDVNNPLTGPEGAAAVYGPQKGATSDVIGRLDKALAHFAKVVRRDIGPDINDIPGSGAAGGLGGGMIAFLGGHLRPGGDIVLEAVNFDQYLNGANLVITGEGQLDFQTVYSKAPIGVAQRAKQKGIPVIAVVGSLGDRFTDVHEHGINAASSIVPAPMTLETASENVFDLIASATEQAIRMLHTGSQVFRPT